MEIVMYEYEDYLTAYEIKDGKLVRTKDINLLNSNDGICHFENGNLVGFFVKDNKAYIYSNNNIYSVNPNNISCVETSKTNGKYNLKVVNDGKLIVDFDYSFYIYPDDILASEKSIGELFMENFNSVESINALIDRYMNQYEQEKHL